MLNYNGYDMIEFLPVSISDLKAARDDNSYNIHSSDSEDITVGVALNDEVRLTSTSYGGDKNMVFFQIDLTRALTSLES